MPSYLARWGVLIAGLAVSLTLCAAVPAKTMDAAYPACFGAASRDPLHRCENPGLTRIVVPTPAEALITPNSACTPVPAPISVCTFGAPPAGAIRTIALVGDSHADHWRPALDVAAQRLGWSAISITRGSCPLTNGVSTAPEPKRTECVDWNRAVDNWLAAHPEVSAIVTSDHPGPVRTLPGQTQLAAWIAGITSAWKTLPATVKHIIVIRDNPFVELDTLNCVERAIAKRADAGGSCALRRGRALHHDPDVLAAKQLHSSRVQLVDLTQFFCDRRLCYPVVGGALVFRDYEDHLTRVFAATLGPYLLRDIKQLTATWR